MPLTPPRPPANPHSTRPTAPPLESLLESIATATSAEELDAALRSARAHYAGSMAEQLERAGARRADYLLNSMQGGGGGA